MEIVDQIIEDYKVIDYEYWQDYTLKKRKIWQIERNIKRLRKELGFSNKVKISNLKEEFDWLFLTKNGKRTNQLQLFDSLFKLRKDLFLLRDYISQNHSDQSKIENLLIKIFFLLKYLKIVEEE